MKHPNVVLATRHALRGTFFHVNEAHKSFKTNRWVHALFTMNNQLLASISRATPTKALSLMARLASSERRSFKTGLRALQLQRTDPLSRGIFKNIASFLIYAKKK